jgi:hypothetical protein
MTDRERDVEALLVKLVTERGGLCEKFTSPGRRNVPDRIVTWPWGQVDFVELKAPGKRPTEAQERDHHRRLGLYATLVVIDHLRGVEKYVMRSALRQIQPGRYWAFYRGETR